METITISASLVDSSDDTEVNVVAAVAAVGKTHRLVTGQTIKWTADFLRAKAHTFIGKPVNILLNEEGNASEHSRRAIGTIKEAHFDEEQQAVVVTAALWGHYYPKTVARIRELFAEKKLNVSMEMTYPKETMVANTDGSQTPTEGIFSGMAFVGKAGDPRSMVFLMASLEEEEKGLKEHSVKDVIKEIGARLMGTYQDDKTLVDEATAAKDDHNAELSAAHEGSFEWLRHGLQDHLSANGSPDQPVYSYVIATYPNYAIYQEGDDYFRIDYKRSGDKLNFGEPQAVDPVYQPKAQPSAKASGDDPTDNTGNLNLGEENTMSEKTQEELQAAKEQNAELKASLDAMATTLGEMKAALEARDKADADRVAAEAATTRANERMAELEKIVPVKDELKAGLLENLKVVDDAAYEALKASFAASAELRAGIAPGEGLENPDPTPGKNEQKITAAEKTQFAEEAKAQFGTGSKSEEKE